MGYCFDYVFQISGLWPGLVVPNKTQSAGKLWPSPHWIGSFFCVCDYITTTWLVLASFALLSLTDSKSIQTASSSVLDNLRTTILSFFQHKPQNIWYFFFWSLARSYPGVGIIELRTPTLPNIPAVSVRFWAFLCSSSLFESSLSTSVLSLSGIPCFFVFELTRLQALRPPPSTALLTLFSSNLMSFVVSFVLILYSWRRSVVSQ